MVSVAPVAMLMVRVVKVPVMLHRYPSRSKSTKGRMGCSSGTPPVGARAPVPGQAHRTVSSEYRKPALDCGFLPPLRAEKPVSTR